jgi:tetratricopeptide (TPR) repeat protein
MRRLPSARRLLVACLAGCLSLGAAGTARGEASGVLVARPRAAPELAELAAGHGAWLQGKLAQAGFAVLTADRKRDAGAPGAAAITRLRELARASGAGVLVVPELHARDGSLAIRLAGYAVDSGLLIDAPQASAPLAAPGSACADTAARLLARLGVAPNAIPSAAPPLLDELVASGRALRWLETGELARAWREVEGRLSPTAMALRETITALAARPETPLVDRAGVLAAMGDGAGAWGLLAPELARASQQPEPDARLLLVAVQTHLARRDPQAAQPHLEALLSRRPDDPEVQLALGRLHELRGDLEAARTAFARSAELDPDSVLPLERLGELASDDARFRAQSLYLAGQREAAQLAPHRAERLFARAIELDPAQKRPVLRAIGAMQLRLGLPKDALAAFAEAQEAGDTDAEVLAGMGVAQRRLGHVDAEASLRRALALEPDHAEALRELAAIYTGSRRSKQAVALLRRAVALEPQRGDVRRELAQALHASGSPAEALDWLEAGDAPEAGSAATLAAAAAIRREQGDLPAAQARLARAIELEPHDAGLQLELAAVLEAQGDAAAAQSARLLARVLEDAPSDATGGEPALDFDALVTSFALQTAEARERSVALLGVREPSSWRRRLRDWLAPGRIDLAALDAALARDLAERFRSVEEPPPTPPELEPALDQIYAFDSPTSLSASAIANVTAAIGVDAVFVARLVRDAKSPENAAEVAPSCAVPGHLELEVRMLSGGYTELPSILVDVECIAGAESLLGVWNLRAFAAYAALVLLSLYPLLRGWGTIVVRIKLPPRTKGFFRIRIGRKPEPVQDAEAEKRRRKREAGRFARSLRSFSRYVKHMAGRETAFRWIPARKRDYVVTVRGPLEDAMSGEIVGHFLEEQRVRVKRGEIARLEYDFCPEDCAVEVVVWLDGQPARGARIAVRGDPRSLRYAREGSAFLYLPPGRHALVVGHRDRACERSLEIDPAKKAMRELVDLGDESKLAFRECPAAVDALLSGDAKGAAALLEAAGNTAAAALLRAGQHRALGDRERAAKEFEAAGHLEEAAELSESAELFERAGNFARAAELYSAKGDPLAAARCYEAAHDYDAALACYDEAGQVARVIDLLERTGAYLEAARRAHQQGDADRAMRNLQLVERRDPAWGEACALMAEVLAGRGEDELAAEKLGEAIEAAGGEAAPVELLARRATLLERAGRRQQAIEALEAARRRDPGRNDLTQRIATLRRDLEATSAEDAPAGGAAPGRRESRYEIQGELGRGGMGIVYKARDRRLGRIVALKRLPENLRNNRLAVEMFLREGKAAAALNHRNIVTVYDAGEEHGVYFISMELLEGLPLSAILERRGRLSVSDTARLGLQIAAGLQYAHERRIVHRDIKTANLFFTRERVVKIMDFGLAKTIEEVRRSSTMIGGTPYYMAPEQAAGETVDHRTDLYAFGVTLFRIVTGSLPFNEGDLAHHHRHTPAPDARGLDASIPDVLAELIARLLAKRPADRPQSAAEVGAALQGLAASR